MKILPEVALTYDDVLLVPQYSDVESRRKLSTSTQLTSEDTRCRSRLFRPIWIP